MRTELPTLDLAFHHGYFSADDIDTVTRAIAEHGTRILFLGLGDPAQQRWAHAHGAATGANVIVTAGGLFDWLSGAHPRPPQWMVGAGLEWLWRLRLEPKRLARRYLAGNPCFIAAVLRQKLGGAVVVAESTSRSPLPAIGNRALARSGIISLAGAAIAAAMGLILVVVLGRFGSEGSGVVLQAIAAFSIAVALARLGTDSAAVWIMPRLRSDAAGLVRPIARRLTLTATIGGIITAG